jgi:hypothetical protein
MRDKNKIIDEIIDSKLQTSKIYNTKPDFSAHLMNRIISESKSIAAERKSDKLVKYIISSFSFVMISITIIIGYAANTSNVSSENSYGVTLESVEKTSSFLNTAISYIQKFFIDVLSFFGVSVSSTSLNIIAIIFLILIVYLIGDRLIFRNKLKQTV